MGTDLSRRKPALADAMRAMASIASELICIVMRHLLDIHFKY